MTDGSERVLEAQVEQVFRCSWKMIRRIRIINPGCIHDAYVFECQHGERFLLDRDALRVRLLGGRP